MKYQNILNEIIQKMCYGNKAEFARAINTSPQTITNWMNRGISKEGLTAIQRAFPDLSSDWLLTGEGEMLRDVQVVQSNDNENASENTQLIPFYDAETTGGYHGLVSSSNTEAELTGYIQAGGWFGGKETAAIRHVGDSMIEYPNGCILVVREVTERRLLVPGRNYVIETDEYRVTKRVQRGSSPNTIALYSSNEEKYEDNRLIHEPFEVEFEDIRRIFSVLGYIVNQSGEYRLIRP